MQASSPRILFVTATRIGDAVLSSGLLGHLIERHPGARLTIACGAPAAPLFEAVPGLERLIVIRKRPFKSHWLGLWWQSAARRWDVVVDLRASGLAWFLAARQRYVKRVRDPGLHRIEQLARVLELETPPLPRLWVAPVREAEARRLIPDGRPVLAIGPTANWGAKEWRAERFAEMVRALTADGGILPGARIAVLGSPDERKRALPLIGSVPADRLIDLYGRELPVAHACLRRSNMFIGNDSGLMHLAAASGIPTLGLFGPSPERHYGPWGAHAAVVRTVQSYEELIGAPDFDHRRSATLMDGLTVEAAVAAARDLWRQSVGTANQSIAGSGQ